MDTKIAVVGVLVFANIIFTLFLAAFVVDGYVASKTKYIRYIKCTQDAANLPHPYDPDGHWYRVVKSNVKDCLTEIY